LFFQGLLIQPLATKSPSHYISTKGNSSAVKSSQLKVPSSLSKAKKNSVELKKVPQSAVKNLLSAEEGSVASHEPGNEGKTYICDFYFFLIFFY
jgi:hypothetical protein